jgi:hemerythrin-like domain-containing protein
MLPSRRNLLFAGATAALAVTCKRGKSEEHEEEEVTPSEDLMREHGVLRRILYVYDEARDRLAAGGDIPLDALGNAAALMQRFVHDYHEKMEEQHVFPVFEHAQRLAKLTAVLRIQHTQGRALTAEVQKLVAGRVDEASRGQLVAALRRFTHTYAAHASREDTELFPELRGLVGADGYHELGEQLEEAEHETLGEDGFAGAVTAISAIERAFGVADLATL